VTQILARYEPGYRFEHAEFVTLFEARGGDFNAVVELADHVRRDLVGEPVSFVINRNINYTNVCTFKCRFCAFSKGPLSLNLRGDPYLFTLDEISERVREAEDRGATEVCLQGGIHPNFDGDYYIDVIAAVRRRDRRGSTFTPSARSRCSRARAAPNRTSRRTSRGSRTRDCGPCRERRPRFSTTQVRKILCPDKINRPISGSKYTAPRTRVGSIEHHHHVRRGRRCRLVGDAPDSHARACKRRPAGFTEFVPLPFVHMATPLFLQGRLARARPSAKPC
jgi:FO synthase